MVCLEYFGLRATCPMISPRRTMLSVELETAAIICFLEPSNTNSSYSIISKLTNT